jgi:uncharacterized heparinase superfamily protein
MNFIRKAQLYYHTLKHLYLRQTLGRIWAVISQKSRPKYFIRQDVPIRGKLRNNSNFCFHDPWNSREKIVAGQFTFLSKTIQLGYPHLTDWQIKQEATLWRYNLHYFQYLYLLTAEEKLVICRDWINSNPLGKGIGWYPYPTSLRVVNWCKNKMGDSLIDSSLYTQGQYLWNNLEFYHPGNHYLENAKALIFLGVYFDLYGSSKKWFEKGLAIFLEELPKQVLADGGYFERSPMYHALMMEGLLDIINILPDSYAKEKKLFSDYVAKMSDFLVSTTFPNNEIGVFNDSSVEIAPPTDKLSRYTESLIKYSPVEKTNFPDTGYFLLNGTDVHMILDAGAIGPDFLPAHAHADIFSYELFAHGQKLILDSGTFSYLEGEIRDYSRSTAAHNTLSIDKVSQVECWKSHRVGKRDVPHVLSYKDTSTETYFEALYEGYKLMIGDNLCHNRKIYLDKESNTIEITDLVTGHGDHLIESYIHLHPALDVQLTGRTISASMGNMLMTVVVDCEEFAVSDSQYFPRFGQHSTNKVITLRSRLHGKEVTLMYKINFS